MSISAAFGKLLDSGFAVANLNKVLLSQLQDLYSAARQQIQALPDLADVASSVELRNMLDSHLESTRGRACWLKRVLTVFGAEFDLNHSEAMQGLIAEAEEGIAQEYEAGATDLVLMLALQRFESYDLAAYSCACAFAKQLGMHELTDLLQLTIEELLESDRILTGIAEQYSLLSEGAVLL